jgi:hypothetical protein
MADLLKFHWKKISRFATAGFPEWYKSKLAGGADE